MSKLHQQVSIDTSLHQDKGNSGSRSNGPNTRFFRRRSASFFIYRPTASKFHQKLFINISLAQDKGNSRPRSKGHKVTTSSFTKRLSPNSPRSSASASASLKKKKTIGQFGRSPLVNEKVMRYTTPSKKSSSCPIWPWPLTLTLSFLYLDPSWCRCSPAGAIWA